MGKIRVVWLGMACSSSGRCGGNLYDRRRRKSTAKLLGISNSLNGDVGTIGWALRHKSSNSACGVGLRARPAHHTANANSHMNPDSSTCSMLIAAYFFLFSLPGP